MYTLLMFLGKAATGLWIVPSSLESATRSRIRKSLKSFWRTQKKTNIADSNSDGTEGQSVDGRRMNLNDTQTLRPDASIPISDPSPQFGPQCEPTDGTASPVNVDCLSPLAQNPTPEENETSSTPHSIQSTPSSPPLTFGDVPDGANKEAEPKPALPAAHPAPQDVETTPSPPPDAAPHPFTGPPHKRALRAYGPALIGMAMTARGEIGFLIASVAESRGIFAPPSRTITTFERDADSTSSLYLVVVWAIVLCTMVGPIAVGGLVRRVKRLDMQPGGVIINKMSGYQM